MRWVSTAVEQDMEPFLLPQERFELARTGSVTGFVSRSEVESTIWTSDEEHERAARLIRHARRARTRER